MNKLRKIRKVKSWIEEELHKSAKIKELENSLNQDGVKVLDNDFEVLVSGKLNSFEIKVSQDLQIKVNNIAKKKFGIYDINYSMSKNKIKIDNIVFESEEELKREIKNYKNEKVIEALKDSLKEQKKKNKKNIKIIEEVINEKIENHLKKCLKVFVNYNHFVNSNLEIVLGEDFFNKQKRLKKVLRHQTVKNIINLRFDKSMDRVFMNIRENNNKIMKGVRDIAKLDPKEIIGYMLQLTVIMRNLNKLDTENSSLKRIKKELKTVLNDIIVDKVEQLVNQIRLKEDSIEDIVNKINSKAILNLVDKDINKVYRKYGVFI
ncbi:hypothetical protein [Arcobacter arenosus]|uniref:hypothetical protein n=1 Tax=Arcobacter arenosus TaxID=2576037 RepID=UPI003BAB98CD